MQFCTVFVKRLKILKNQALSVSHENYSGIAQISDSVRQDLIWWVDNLQSSIAVSFDASKTVCLGGGWGWGLGERMSHYRRHWTGAESELHINCLELKAAMFALNLLWKIV